MENIEDFLIDLLEVDGLDELKKRPFSEFEAWDSMKHVLLIVTLEKEISRKFTAEEIVGMKDYESLIKIVEGRNE